MAKPLHRAKARLDARQQATPKPLPQGHKLPGSMNSHKAFTPTKKKKY